MSPQLRLLAALRMAEQLASAGGRAAYCLTHAAETHAVSRGELAAAWVQKIMECQRARVVVAGMAEADRGAHKGGR